MALPLPWPLLRAVLNVANLSTPLGVLVAVLLGGRVQRGPYALLLAHGGGLRRLPRPAVTLGSVVLLRHPTVLAGRPRLLRHEARHVTQYACCLGLPMLVLYGLAAAWSYVRSGDPASRNLFETRAGLADGGYATGSTRRSR